MSRKCRKNSIVGCDSLYNRILFSQARGEARDMESGGFSFPLASCSVLGLALAKINVCYEGYGCDGSLKRSHNSSLAPVVNSIDRNRSSRYFSQVSIFFKETAVSAISCIRYRYPEFTQ